MDVPDESMRVAGAFFVGLHQILLLRCERTISRTSYPLANKGFWYPAIDTLPLQLNLVDNNGQPVPQGCLRVRLEGVSTLWRYLKRRASFAVIHGIGQQTESMHVPGALLALVDALPMGNVTLEVFQVDGSTTAVQMPPLNAQELGIYVPTPNGEE